MTILKINLIVSGGIFDTDSLSAKLNNLRNKSEQSDFWSDTNLAKMIMQNISELENQLGLVDGLINDLNDITEFYKIAMEEQDNDAVLEYLGELKKINQKIDSEVFKLQFNGDTDIKNCYLEIHAGAGGTESQDWANMLRRMYLRWAEKNNWFGNDEVMTNAAFSIHSELVKEGFDSESDEYYNEIDTRLAEYFPNKFASTEEKVEEKKPVQTVASAGRKQQGRKTVKLTRSQVAIAKKLGVPLEEYAKFVKE